MNALSHDEQLSAAKQTSKWARLAQEPLCHIIRPDPSVINSVMLPPFLDSKYTNDIELIGLKGKGRVFEIAATGQRILFGFLLDLISLNIINSADGITQSGPQNGVVIVLDCCYQWVDDTYIKFKQSDELLTEDVLPPNSSILKLLVNMNMIDQQTLPQKLRVLKKSLIIQSAFKKEDGYQDYSIDHVIILIKQLIYNFDQHILSQRSIDRNLPLKCIIIDRVETLYWEDNNAFKSKLKELHNLAYQASITLNCKIYIAKVKIQST